MIRNLLSFRPLALALGLAACVSSLRTACAQGAGADHWAFRPPARGAPPKVMGNAWSINPIDAFVLHALEEFGLSPRRPADRATLLRRVTFDLTGLPPTPDELHAFVADKRPDAYERVVDRLLGSTSYGVRWTQHWLDLARYADTDGYEFDAVRPNAWRYRDWVVDALNADMPYDRLVTLQIAGDVVEPGRTDAFIATGFERCYPDMVDLNDQKLRRQNALNDITETTALVFMGLTLGCARCHDHKTDPLPQADFYRLQAFFTPVRFRDDLPVDNPNETARFDDALRAWQAEVGSLEATLASAKPSEAKELRRRLDRLKKEDKPQPPTARGVDETSDPPAPTHILLRGEISTPGAGVEPGVPRVLEAESRNNEHQEKMANRRVDLAAWLTRPDNPLTARVIVNRLWSHHFGRGLVTNPSDFGVTSEKPSHPELLDWLACELIERGWSLKHLQRLIVTSATYRQSSHYDESAARLDPENSLLWRHARRRLDGEAIRDAVLTASGQRSDRMGGPGIYPDLPQELAKLNAQGVAWPVTPDRSEHSRRSLYIFVRRNLRYPFFEAFDRPDTNASCPRRPSTTTAPQALSMLNDSLVHSAATTLANSLFDSHSLDDDARITLAYERILGRAPSPDERAAARQLLTHNTWEDLCLALFNVNEFLYLD